MSFDGLVKKLEDKGYDADYAKKIAGKVAVEKGDVGGHKEAAGCEDDMRKEFKDKRESYGK